MGISPVHFFRIEIDRAGKRDAVPLDGRLFPPVTGAQDQWLDEIEFVAEIIPCGLPFQVDHTEFLGPLLVCVPVHLEGFKVIIDTGRQLVGAPENLLLQDVFGGHGIRTDRIAVERVPGGVIGLRILDSGGKADLGAAEITQHRIDPKTQFRLPVRSVILRTRRSPIGRSGGLILPAIHRHFRCGEVPGQFILSPVEGRPHGQPEMVAGVIGQIQTRTLGGNRRPVPIPEGKIILSAYGIRPLLFRTAHRRLLVVESVTSGDGGDVECRFAFSFSRDDVDDAGHGGITVEDAARAPDDFDLFHLAQGDLKPVDGGHIRPVQSSSVELNLYLPEGAVAAHPAQVYDGKGLMTAVRSELNPLLPLQDLHHARRTGIPDLLFRDDRYIGRHLPDLFLIARRRHDHFLQDRNLAGVIGRRPGKNGCRRVQQNQDQKTNPQKP